MRLRVLTAWSGSGPCGSVGEYSDPLARDQIRAGHAEPVAECAAAAPAPVVETAQPDVSRVETAVSMPTRPLRKGRRP